MAWLRGFDLAIESDWSVPGALTDWNAVGPVDLRITGAAAIHEPAVPPPVYRREGAALLFHAAGVAQYRCSAGAINVAPLHGADPAMVSGLLIATAIPAALWLRGDTVLHAAGVVAAGGGTALLVSGASGAGKSTVVRQLLDDGAALLADDSVRLSDGIASGLAGGTHRVAGGTRVYEPLDPPRPVLQAAVGAILIVSRTDGPPCLDRLTPVAGLQALLTHQHRPAIPALLRSQGGALASLAFLARQCPIYSWKRSFIALSLAEREMLLREGLWEGERRDDMAAQQ